MLKELADIWKSIEHFSEAKGCLTRALVGRFQNDKMIKCQKIEEFIESIEGVKSESICLA